MTYPRKYTPAGTEEVSGIPQPPRPKTTGKQLYYDSWDAYHESLDEWHKKHEQKPALDLQKITYLYHAAPQAVEQDICTKGLFPRNPQWTKSYDASKDGFLSMSKTEVGAGAMGGKSFLIRIDRAAASKMTWREFVGTEVKTTGSIDSKDIEIKRGNAWVKVQDPSTPNSNNSDATNLPPS